ncbi:hypothetical protein ARC20_04870 [Stenotrophomonas panacihumi]|uniref:Autotransporter domain-containing protein n=1 Tax=Stenotrophomonas panacihumi TaxID=676599 RepID=A0A0R0AYZ1_9GAMM|nr:autotransporter serine protease [Stenotrophomonas panacihumi]KRG46775.1 hypothetical protein ARC20_04870 [Stenotrophomonas panacihumi]PTN54638.1 autotransporter domain-containing protein [Stenotrophomonas panacihumi]
MNKAVLAKTTLLASALAVALSACGGGGGGGNTRSDPPPTAPPVSPPPPPTSPPPTSPPPPPQPAINAHLSLINALDAASGGYTGAGVRIGVVDSGVNRNHPALRGRVVANYNYLDPKTNNLAVDDVVGHGTTVAQLAAGSAFGSWPGGVAPGAQIVSARIIADKEPEDDGSGDGNEVDGALGLAPIHDDLIAAGVKIMNNSWGGLYWTNANATAPIAAEYRPFIQANGGLVVFAAGNESRANPSDMASLPSQPGPNGTMPAADLEKGWLTVAALDTSTPSRLEYYSNACGVAMRYCLVAPGTVMFTGTNDTAGNPTYWYGSGTSYAAPLVSGAAAVVWQKFPYFSNDLVRQTLLGTATDLGAPGIDAVFGNGLLNVAKALNGPARLDFGDATVSVPAGTTSEWSNDLSGAGGVIVGGAGTLRLTGANASTGALRVQDSARVDLFNRFGAGIDIGATATASLSRVTLTEGVTNRGVLEMGVDASQAGAVQVNGDVRNSGNVKLGMAGNLAISGAYVQDAGARLSYLINGQALHAGSAQLAGELYVYGVYGSYVGGTTRQYVLSTGSGALAGHFDTFGYDSSKLLLNATVGYDASNAWLDITRVDVVAAAASALGTPTAATLGSATRVEDAFDALQGSAGTLTAPVAGADVLQGAAKIQQVAGATALQATLDSLSGQLHTLAGSATFDGIDQNRRTLATHFDELHARQLPAGAWMRETGGLGQSGGAAAYDLRGWMVGQDVRLGDTVLGYAFGENRAFSQVAESGDRGRDRQTQAQVYGGWSRGGFYALGQLGAGHYARDLDRHLLLGDTWFGTTSRYDGQFSSAGVEGGFRFGLGARLSLTPYAGLQYASVETPAFAEQGGLGYGLRSEGGTTTRTTALGGLRAGFARGGWDWNAYAEWQQPLSQRGDTLQASFTGVEAWAPLRMLDEGSATLWGLSASAHLSARARMSLAYDQRVGSNPAHAWSLRYAFGF